MELGLQFQNNEFLFIFSWSSLGHRFLKVTSEKEILLGKKYEEKLKLSLVLTETAYIHSFSSMYQTVSMCWDDKSEQSTHSTYFCGISPWLKKENIKLELNIVQLKTNQNC